MIGCMKAFTQRLVVETLVKIFMSGVYCQIHREKLIHLRAIENKGDSIECGYCPKCNKEYCEYSDISPIYISNYEWMYGEDNLD